MPQIDASSNDAPAAAWRRMPRLTRLLCFARRVLNGLQAPFALGVRYYIAQVFFLSGLTKIRDWDTTLLLFTEEYHVPILPPALAAVMGAAGELVLPCLLLPGLAGRFAALGLSVVNVMAVISYPDLSGPPLVLHGFWATLLAYLALHGPGQWSLDAWIMRWLRRGGRQQKSPGLTT